MFPSVIQTDLHACILHVFDTILRTGPCQAAAVPQALPILRKFVVAISQSANQGTGAQLRNAIFRLLGILKYSQQREFEAAIACEKNVILALTIVLTSSGNALNPADRLIRRVADELIDCLGSRLTTKVAAGCCRSLLVATKRSPTQEAIATALLPPMLDFLANPSDVEGLDETRPVIAQTLCAFVASLEPQKRPAALSLVIPAFLARASSGGSKAYPECAARLLELASSDQESFRIVVARMDTVEKKFMEEVIREGRTNVNGVGRGKLGIDVGAQEPTIALKMNFGT